MLSWRKLTNDMLLICMYINNLYSNIYIYIYINNLNSNIYILTTYIVIYIYILTTYIVIYKYILTSYIYVYKLTTYIGARVREFARTRSAGVVGLRAGALDVTANMFKVFFLFCFFIYLVWMRAASGRVLDVTIMFFFIFYFFIRFVLFTGLRARMWDS